ncbi:hypothetical protein D3C87_1005480 [compost metagenome]
MRRFRFASFMLAGLLGLGSALPAQARMGGTIPEFERYLRTLPGSNFKRVPDSSGPGLLYAGRLAEFSTILRVHTDGGKIVRQRIEVALPAEKRDDYALVIISRFLSEFAGHPGEIQGVMDQARAMRGNIVGSGRRAMTTSYRGTSITLSLDSSPNEIHPHPTRGSWGLLFWSAEAERIRKPGS